MRDLITIHLLTSDKDVSDSLDAFVCALCMTELTNATKPVALKTGTILCTRCVDQFVRRRQTVEGPAQDPVTLGDIHPVQDVIVIHNVGTGFAGSTEDDPSSKVVSLYQPSMT